MKVYSVQKVAPTARNELFGMTVFLRALFNVWSDIFKTLGNLCFVICTSTYETLKHDNVFDYVKCAKIVPTAIKIL